MLERIRKESRTEREKGQWFEQLFMRVAQRSPEFDLDCIQSWGDWVEREELTGLDARVVYSFEITPYGVI